METLVAPAARAAAMLSATSSGPCRRPSSRSAATSMLCAPMLKRVTPACTEAVKSPRSSAPGLHSSVTSAPSTRPNRSRTRLDQRRELFCWKQRWCSAAKVERLKWQALHVITYPAEAPKMPHRSPSRVDQSRAPRRSGSRPSVSADRMRQRRRSPQSRSTGRGSDRRGRAGRGRAAVARVAR